MKTQQNSKKQLYYTPQIQYDKDDFVKSFDIDTANDEQLYQFYHKYGFIVFKNILAKQQIDRTVDDLWNSTAVYYKQTRNKIIDRNKKQTWDNLRGFQRAFGFVGDSILQQPQIWQNRKNPKIYKCFKRGYQANIGEKLAQPLISCFDRGSLMLPSKQNQQWRSQDIYHFDIDPWLWTGLTDNRHTKYDYDPDRIMLLLGEGNYQPYVGYTKLAGVLALSDTNEISGGFSCAPGFQNYIKQWCESHRLYASIQKDEKLLTCFQKIYMKAGSLLIFSRELPHNIYPNDSDNFRYAQYLRMTPLSALCLDQELIQARKKLIKMILPKNFNASDPISREIFMLDQNQQGKKQIKLNQNKAATQNINNENKCNIH